jgi:hypothetical protein
VNPLDRFGLDGKTVITGTMAEANAVARILFGPGIRIQAPPNLLDDQFALLLRAGMTTGAGSPVAADHSNPRQDWLRPRSNRPCSNPPDGHPVDSQSIRDLLLCAPSIFAERP